ncbi:MAG TPA: DUF1801 domain-containing protein [Hydrogenophaga sp.]|nr:DUF1801 domain-containing protein [Hydrogenophaga sp.]
MPALLLFSGAVEQDPAIDRWLESQSGDLAAIASEWFEVMRGCGANVRELMHDGYPTVCVQDAPFAYVGTFKAHVNVGFFHGASLPDPEGLLEGEGKYMRHVKLKPGRTVDARALKILVNASYQDILARLTAVN